MSSIEYNRPLSIFATSLVLMAARNVADKYENFNYSLITSTISATTVHKPQLFPCKTTGSSASLAMQILLAPAVTAS